MKIFIKTFGCQINNYDNFKIYFNLKKNFFFTLFFYFDILILNTCSVREFSQKKIFFFLRKIKKLFNFLTIMSGCSSNLFFYLLIKKTYIDLIINSNSIFYLNILIYMYYFYNCKQIFLIFFFKKNILYIINNFYIIIMEGCNKYCSYCIIPYTRGREFYENFFLILKKIYIFNLNVNEIFFLGQNVNSYKFFWFDKIIDFYLFLKIFFEFSRNFLFNFITSNLKNIKYNLSFYNKLKTLHLPLQSASNKILFYMKRNYKFKSYKIFVYYVKKYIFDFFFTTDFIICFPKESSPFFNKTILSIEKLLFDKSYIFIYNIRSYTSSSFFFNNINCLLKKNRFLAIKLKLKNNLIYINKLFLNKIIHVFIKFLCLNYNNLFFGYLGGRVVKFFLKLKIFFLNKKFFFKIKKKILNFFLLSFI